MATQKTLSKGTLSLRFMQNAHRAKQQKEVELDKAEVKDDGEWEVSQDVREAWGIGQSQTAPQITYETSYLPFVFRSPTPPNADLNLEQGTEDVTVLPKGRRRFKQGLEVVEKDLPLPGRSDQPDQASPKPRLTRLKSISGSSTMAPKSNKGSRDSDKAGKTARQGIFDHSGTGADLRSRDIIGVSSSKHENGTNPHASSGSGFMKPSGVDEPPESKRPRVPSSSSVSTSGSPLTKANSKRDRESTADRLDDEGKKRKKKKTKTVPAE